MNLGISIFPGQEFKGLNPQKACSEIQFLAYESGNSLVTG